jgi:hypothetical protein
MNDLPHWDDMPMPDDTLGDMQDLLSGQRDLFTTQGLPAPQILTKAERHQQLLAGLHKESLTSLMPTLPPPDTTVWIINNGSGAERIQGRIVEAFDFGAFIVHLMGLVGTPCQLHASTWAMNRNHALMFERALNDGAFNRFVLFVDPYLSQRTPDVHSIIANAVLAHPDTARYLAFKNHAKIACLSGEHGIVTVASSANFSAQPRVEQYTVSTSNEVYEFFKREFFDEMLARADAIK